MHIVSKRHQNKWIFATNTLPHTSQQSASTVYTVVHTHIHVHKRTQAVYSTQTHCRHMQTHHQLRNGHNWGLVYSQDDIVGCSAVPHSNDRGTEEIKGCTSSVTLWVASGGSTVRGNEQLPHYWHQLTTCTWDMAKYTNNYGIVLPMIYQFCPIVSKVEVNDPS